MRKVQELRNNMQNCHLMAIYATAEVIFLIKYLPFRPVCPRLGGQGALEDLEVQNPPMGSDKNVV